MRSLFFEGQMKMRLPGFQFPHLSSEDSTNFDAEMVGEGN